MMMNMRHLSTERLAALADEEPTAEEREHLAACAQCLRERFAYGALLRRAAAEVELPVLPLTRWETLAPALSPSALVGRSESTPAPAAPAAPAAGVARRAPGPWWWRSAAAVLLLAGGVVVGRATAPAAAGTPGTAIASAAPVATVAPGAPASLAADTLHPYASRDEALAALASAERAYEQASAYLAEHDPAAATVENPSTIQARLATLDRVAATTREAVHQAPYDPVINRYYLTTLGVRQATLRQLSQALPSGVQVGSY